MAVFIALLRAVNVGGTGKLPNHRASRDLLPTDALDDLQIPGREKLRGLGREVIVCYPDGMGRLKLRLPFAKQATGRNLKTLKKLRYLGRALGL